MELKFTNNKKQLHKYVIQNKYISYTTAIHEEIHLTCNTNTTAMHTKYNTITLELEAGFQIFLPVCHNTNCPKSLKIVQSKLRHFLEPIQEGFNLTVLLASYWICRLGAPFSLNWFLRPSFVIQFPPFSSHLPQWIVIGFQKIIICYLRQQLSLCYDLPLCRWDGFF